MILYTVLLEIRLYKLLQYCKSCGHANKAITTTTTTRTVPLVAFFTFAGIRSRFRSAKTV